jgi:hypothetical protein
LHCFAQKKSTQNGLQILVVFRIDFHLSPGLKAKKILEEVKPGIWTFPVFTEAFCDQLEAELVHFLDSGSWA